MFIILGNINVNFNTAALRWTLCNWITYRATGEPSNIQLKAITVGDTVALLRKWQLTPC